MSCFPHYLVGVVCMGDIDAFGLPGLKCYFGSEDHYPQHFEVLRRGQWRIRVFFLQTTRKRGLSFDYKKAARQSDVSVGDEADLLAMVLKHKRHLLREWNLKVRASRARKQP
jgi:hypothetical protein